jgi:hypothetical protein
MFFCGVIYTVHYEIYASQVDTLKEIKQVQLQILELQASLGKVPWRRSHGSPLCKNGDNERKTGISDITQKWVRSEMPTIRPDAFSIRRQLIHKNKQDADELAFQDMGSVRYSRIFHAHRRNTARSLHLSTPMQSSQVRRDAWRSCGGFNETSISDVPKPLYWQSQGVHRLFTSSISPLSFSIARLTDSASC